MTCLTETEPGKKWVKQETGGWNAEKIRCRHREVRVDRACSLVKDLQQRISVTVTQRQLITFVYILHGPNRCKCEHRSRSFTVEKVSPARLPKPQLAERASQRTQPLLWHSAPIHVCQEIHLLIWKALFILGNWQDKAWEFPHLSKIWEICTQMSADPCWYKN